MYDAVAKITKLIVYSTVTLCSYSVNTDMVSCRPITKKHRHEVPINLRLQPKMFIQGITCGNN